MSRPVLAISHILPTSFKILFSDWRWFFVLPMALTLISALSYLFAGFITSMVLGMILVPLMALLITAKALAILHGQDSATPYYQDKFAAKILTLILSMVLGYGLYLGLIYVLGISLFADPEPEIVELGKIYWDLIQTGGEDPEALTNMILAMSPDLLVSAALKVMLICGFLLVISLFIIALFFTFTPVVTNDRQWFAAFSRSAGLSRGYFGKIVLIYLLFIGILFVFSLVTGTVSAIFTLTGALGQAESSAVIQVLAAPTTAFLFIMAAVTYDQLLSIRGENPRTNPQSVFE